MFARQIAVMKGQAWNVVETLKQEDHGPLELTRRARVCVWDDLVDVPVAIPMRVPSAETSSRKAPIDQQEEMDIGASYASAPPGRQQIQHDLLGSPTTDLPNPNRFDLTREDSTTDISYMPSNPEDGPSSPTLLGRDLDRDYAKEARDSLGASATLPSRPAAKGKTRFSFEFPRRENTPKASSRRQRSMSTRSGKRAPPMIYEGDDLEGDLGYAAASDMEHHRRKVIVERLETVKSKKPVFTWC